jgi:hypothetical protein
VGGMAAEDSAAGETRRACTRPRPPEVGDRGHVDADVVPGDDALGLDRRRDDPQRHPVQHVDERDDEPEAGIPRTPHPAQPEQHPCSYCFTTLADKAIPSRNSAMTTTTTISW